MRLWTSILILLTTSTSFALDVYTLVDKNCRFTSGLIIDVEDNDILMLTLDGKSQRIPSGDLDFLLIYNTVENPIAQIDIDEELKAQLKTVYIDESKTPYFQGWAVKFVENLIIFYDTSGKLHVLENEHISKIRPTENTPPRYTLASAPISPALGDAASRCQISKKLTVKELRPTRILGDKIQISEFLSNFENGFFALESFQERTYLYSRPMVFEPDSKLGFVIGEQTYSMPKLLFPLYFQWGTGRPYRFQSFTQLGAAKIDLAPSLEPQVLMRSEVKSHVFHGGFAGNLEALPAGTPWYSNRSGELVHGWPEKARSSISFNYLGFIGGDWGPWSLSLGTFYPLFYVQVEDDQREILSSSTSPFLRAMFTTKQYRFKVWGSKTKASGLNGDNLKINNGVDAAGTVAGHKLDATILRAGFEWSITESVKFEADQVYIDGVYNEELVAASVKSRFSFTHIQTGASISQKFGEYVTLHGNFTHLRVIEDYDFKSKINHEETFKNIFGGRFEFIF